MLNKIFLALIVVSLLLAGWSGRMEETVGAVFDAASGAVELAIGLVGAMAFFLGLMKVAEEAGLLAILARVVGPVLRRIFPGIPAGHPALSAMILNIGANMAGLANAATPFGIRAMEELDRLNPKKGTATNAMVVFLAVNTAGLALLPSGVAVMRASVGSEDPFGIWLPTMFASGCATVVGVTTALLLGRLPAFRRSEPKGALPVAAAGGSGAPDASGAPDDVSRAEPPAPTPAPRAIRGRVIAWWAFLILFLGLAAREVVQRLGTADPREVLKTMMSSWILALIVSSLLLFGWTRGVRVYDALVEGAKEGFNVALRIIPFMVAILVAVGMFRGSGGIELLQSALGPLTSAIGMPVEALPMAVLRPLSGGGAYAVMADIMREHGADSLIGYMVSTFQGSTETTFYVLAVYFGAVKVTDGRHALPACLTADVAGILAAVLVVNLLFG